MKVPNPDFFKQQGKDWVDWAKALKMALEGESKKNPSTILQAFPSTAQPSAEQSGQLIFAPDTNVPYISYNGAWNTLAPAIDYTNAAFYAEVFD